MSARGISRRVGMLVSDFTQYQYLTTKDSIPCDIPVIPAKAVMTVVTLCDGNVTNRHDVTANL
jgi:hypothetical protein